MKVRAIDLYRAAQQLVPDPTWIGRIRTRTDSGGYLVQIAGRGIDLEVPAHAGGMYKQGDHVLGIGPAILCQSAHGSGVDLAAQLKPDGSSYSSSDFPDLAAIIEAHPEVIANLAAAHSREHTMGSHLDVDGIPTPGDGLVLEADRTWRPNPPPSSASRMFLLMGMG